MEDPNRLSRRGSLAAWPVAKALFHRDDRLGHRRQREWLGLVTTEICDRVEEAVEVAPAEGSGASTDRFGDIEATYRAAARLFEEAEIAGRGGWESEGRADAEVEVIGGWGGHGGVAVVGKGVVVGGGAGIGVVPALGLATVVVAVSYCP